MKEISRQPDVDSYRTAHGDFVGIHHLGLRFRPIGNAPFVIDLLLRDGYRA